MKLDYLARKRGFVMYLGKKFDVIVSFSSVNLLFSTYYRRLAA
jgi:hypothetical protein